MNNFEDHFSKQAQTYVQYRPQYPPALYTYLASIAPDRRLAWDCGTGNGQAARGLAEHFQRVIATDGSAEQIAQAEPHERITYRVQRAEEVELEPGSVDLVTAAVAVHWFDLDSFYEIVRRVVKTGGILAAWMYHLPRIEPAIDEVVRQYYEEVVAGYWPERFHFIDERYQTLPFPFRELTPPTFEMQAIWNLEQLAGFLKSWSATQRYQNERGEHPLNVIWQDLSAAWGEPGHQRLIHWPMVLRVGQIH